MHLYAAVARANPYLGYALVLVGLVDDLGDQLGPQVDEAGVDPGELDVLDSVIGGILDEQGEQGEDAADEEEDDDRVDEEEDEQAAPHGDCWRCWRRRRRRRELSGVC